jgi:hypothetical protein
MGLKLVGGEKAVRLNPYKRAKLGTEVTLNVNGAEVVGLIPPKGKYTYLTLDEVEYYVSGELVSGVEYTTEAYEPKAAKAKAEPAEAAAE